MRCIYGSSSVRAHGSLARRGPPGTFCGCRPWSNFRPHYPWVGAAGGNPLDFRLRLITIQQLLDRQGGWNRTITADPLFRMGQVAQDLGQSLPPSISEFVDWMTRKTRLDFLLCSQI